MSRPIEEKVHTLGCAVIVMSRRLLKLETSEKYRAFLRDIIRDVDLEVCEPVVGEPKS